MEMTGVYLSDSCLDFCSALGARRSPKGRGFQRLAPGLWYMGSSDAMTKQARMANLGIRQMLTLIDNKDVLNHEERSTT